MNDKSIYNEYHELTEEQLREEVRKSMQEEFKRDDERIKELYDN